MGQSSVPTGEMKSVTILRPSRYEVAFTIVFPFPRPSLHTNIVICRGNTIAIIVSPIVSVNLYFFSFPVSGLPFQQAGRQSGSKLKAGLRITFPRPVLMICVMPRRRMFLYWPELVSVPIPGGSACAPSSSGHRSLRSGRHQRTRKPSPV